MKQLTSTEVSELKTNARVFKKLEVCLVAEERYFKYDVCIRGGPQKSALAP
jgi:hypothetical protein